MINGELAKEMETKQSAVDKLNRDLESLSTDVPEDLMVVLYVPCYYYVFLTF